VQHELAAVWLDHDAEIATLADRVDRLGGVVRSLPLSHVLCHADIHMFVVGAKMGSQPITASQQALFAQGYGPIKVNWPVLAVYRYQRVVEDLYEFARSVLFGDNVGEDSMREDLGWIRQQFVAGDAADIARSSDRYLNFSW